ncbi:hypothetical protein SxD43FB_22430 [Sphingobium sp. D43FB]|uniref:IclR family transcriptional regulator domain-containing protein n=1 Tax=Sphingobium sp. KCTC 72723 TaxID=2733867 RepID=UPI000BB53A0A|nr:hypothetical protein SxD43FB_22430 [Sphingobium sp. D43FB]
MRAATIIEPRDIREQLAQARERGWAAEIEETSPHLMCLAVPIVDRIGKAHAAISVSIIDPLPTLTALLERIPFLLQARLQIEDKLFLDSR